MDIENVSHLISLNEMYCVRFGHGFIKMGWLFLADLDETKKWKDYQRFRITVERIWVIVDLEAALISFLTLCVIEMFG